VNIFNENEKEGKKLNSSSNVSRFIKSNNQTLVVCCIGDTTRDRIDSYLFKDFKKKKCNKLNKVEVHLLVNEDAAGGFFVLWGM